MPLALGGTRAGALSCGVLARYPCQLCQAAKILVTEKPLTVDDKVSALASLSKKPKVGQVVYWPNVDGVNIPMDPFGFLESIRHNWL